VIPLEDFFRKPDKVSLRLAPGGEWLAWLEPHERRLNVTVMELASGRTRRVTQVSERDVAGFLWASDERLVYLRDQAGDENWRLYAVGRDGSNPLELTPFDGVKCELVDELEDDDDAILFQMNRRCPERFDAWRLDVRNGELELVAENPGNVQSWIPDHDGRVRLATTTDGVNTGILYRRRVDEPWTTVATYDFKESARPLLFDFDGRGLYVTSNVGRDRAAICEYDLATGREGRLVYAHPEVDVGQLLYSRRRRCLTGVAFEVDRLEHEFFDSERRRLQEFVDARLPGRQNQLTSHDRAERRFVVHSGSDRGMGVYYLLDAQAPALTELFPVSPWLDESRLAPMRPIRYRSRDGLTIRGYLTTPAGAPARRLPLVVNPHGGPWHRDSWGFDAEVQFLASRGYAVLQPNFRGSTGFGRRFLEAGFGEWGRAMQDDVSDAVSWAVQQGVADPRRVAIYGASYGGYAALSGLTRTPELYACGVSYVGVSNLFSWFEAIPPYWKPYLAMMYEMVGHPERDAERLRDTSPFFHADRIRVPLLVAQGGNDPRVRQQESDQIVAALRARGVDVAYLLRDDEGHGFVKEENRFAFYRELERFLAAHLKPQPGTPA